VHGGERPREELVQPAADEVDPEERVPRLFAKVGLAEPERRQLAQQQVPVDPFAGRERLGIEALERGLPAVDERQAGIPPGVAHVRPAVIEAVVAHRRGQVGLEDEQLVEERGNEVGQGGHGLLRGVGRGLCVPPVSRSESIRT